MPDNEAAPAPTSAANMIAGEGSTPPPAEATPPAPEPTTADPAAEAKWFSGIEDEDIRGFAESKNWGTVADAIKSYKNLEGMRGVPEEELARLPKDGDVEGMTKLMRRLGAPEEATGYGELAGIEGEALEWTQKLLHESDVPKATAQKLLSAQAERLSSAQQAAQEAFVAQSQKDMDGLRDKWGSAYENNMEAAKRAAQRLDVGEATLLQLESSIGTTKFMEMFAAHGNATREAGFVDTEDVHTGLQHGMSPEAARAKVHALEADPQFQSQLMSNDETVRNRARAERRKLLEFTK